MAIFRIPTADGATFSTYQIEVELDGVPFRLDLYFNSRQGAWFMNLRDINGELLRSGISVVSGFPLLKRMKQLSRPEGRVFAVTIAQDEVDAADLTQLGTEVVLVYEGDA